MSRGTLPVIVLSVDFQCGRSGNGHGVPNRCVWAVGFVSVFAMTPLRTSAAANPETVGRLVVLDLDSGPELATLASDLTEAALDEIRSQFDEIEVIGASEVRAMLEVEASKQLVGCNDDTACFAEIGAALGADHLLIGRLSRVGSNYQLSLRLIRSVKADVARFVSESLPDQDRLLEAVRQGARYLVDGKSERGLAVIEVGTPGDVSINGAMVGVAPGRFLVSPGAHEVAVSMTLGGTIERAFTLGRYERGVVDRGETAELGPRPWYRKWWIWTVGAVVVAGATTAVVLANDDGSGSEPVEDRAPLDVSVDFGDF